MKAKISALMDGELAQHEAGGALESLRDEGEARELWRRYHLIGDLMRDSNTLSSGFGAGFSSRVADRIAREPTVLAPPPSRRRVEAARLPVWALSAAASLAAVALVGWVAFGPGDESQVAAVQPPVVAAQEAPQVAPPAAASDYLLAHQVYSPRNSLQGVAPYVRTVSGNLRGPGR
jgi:sigma-E factor negative regulatory protein RseA